MRIYREGNNIQINTTINEINDVLNANYDAFDDEAYYEPYSTEANIEYNDAVSKLISCYYDEMCEA